MRFNFCLVAVVFCLAIGAHGDENIDGAKKYLQQAYPAPDAGQTRHVLFLPAKPNEDDLQVEIIVGKKVMGDSVNHFWFAGSIEEVNIEGWGFQRYVVRDMGQLQQTEMGGGVPSERWAQLPGRLIRYNSKLPVAVYAPQDAVVKYRIWSTSSESEQVPNG